MYNFSFFSLYSSCILLTIKRASVIPLPGIKPNCVSSSTTNALILFSNTLLMICIPCSNNFTLLCVCFAVCHISFSLVDWHQCTSLPIFQDFFPITYYLTKFCHHISSNFPICVYHFHTHF